MSLDKCFWQLLESSNTPSLITLSYFCHTLFTWWCRKLMTQYLRKKVKKKNHKNTIRSFFNLILVFSLTFEPISFPKSAFINSLFGYREWKRGCWKVENTTHSKYLLHTGLFYLAGHWMVFCLGVENWAVTGKASQPNKIFQRHHLTPICTQPLSQ